MISGYPRCYRAPTRHIVCSGQQCKPLEHTEDEWASGTYLWFHFPYLWCSLSFYNTQPQIYWPILRSKFIWTIWIKISRGTATMCSCRIRLLPKSHNTLTGAQGHRYPTSWHWLLQTNSRNTCAPPVPFFRSDVPVNRNGETGLFAPKGLIALP